MPHNYQVPKIPYVLLAEDDQDDQMFFNEAFVEVNLNLSLVIMNNGIELMDYLHILQGQLPRLIFLDLNMPLKNGFECLKELKGDEQLKNIPVIMYSTSKSVEDYEKSLQLKAHLYLTKPNSFIQLKKIIHKILVTDFVNNLSEQPKEKYFIFSED